MSQPDNRRSRILVADDSAAHRSAVRRELQALEVDVLQAESGVQALRIISVERPDLVTLDIEMPDLNGYRVLDQLRASERTMAVPVIMISGKPGSGERLSALEAGAVEYFSKPFPEGKLKALVSRILERLTSNRSTTVCCLERDQQLSERMGQRLLSHGYRFRAFSTVESLLAEFDSAECDVLILDLHLPNQDSYRVLDGLQERCDASVIGLTDSVSRGDLIHAFQLGISDFLRKPLLGEELVARVDHLLQVRRNSAKLERLAVVDPLTELSNRADLGRRLPGELSGAIRHRRDLGVLMIDIDHFKGLNDTYGHPFGDEVLQGVAKAMLSGLRASDFLVRYGGEEFLLLVAEATTPGLRLVGERLRQTVAKLRFSTAGEEVRVTVSVGACLWEHHKLRASLALSELVKPADVALYEAKRNGRNQLRFGETSVPLGVRAP